MVHRERDTQGHSSWNKDDDAEGHAHTSIKDDTADDDTEGHNTKWRDSHSIKDDDAEGRDHGSV